VIGSFKHSLWQFILFLMKTMYSGVIGADLSSLLNGNKPLTLRMAVICGSSSCHVAVSIELNHGDLSFVTTG